MNNPHRIVLASDNCSGVHPKVMQAIAEANHGQVSSYGYDPYTQVAIQEFKKILGENIEVLFVTNGTGANVTAFSSILQPFEAVVAAQTSHLHEDECGAPERITGSKFISLPSSNGKITVEQIQRTLVRVGDEHRSQVRVVSITQSTEYGTVYTLDEIRQIADFCHKNKLFLHVDGARIANAAAALGVGFREMLVDTGVDAVSFGATKNGLMMGEAIIFFGKNRFPNAKYFRKQNMQLASKMRFLSAQFIPYLAEKIWLQNAEHANQMAKLFYQKAKHLPITFTQKVEVNVVFAILPPEIIEPLQEKFYFYVWNEYTNEVRLMFSFQTTEQEVEKLVLELEKLLK